ncbi:MAG: hypothetical protein WHT46_07535 [Candidatus Geothermincolales bacterium]
MRRIVRALVIVAILFIASELGVTLLVETRMRMIFRDGTGHEGRFHLNSFPTVLSLAKGWWREAQWSWEGETSGEGETADGWRGEIVLGYGGRLRMRDFRWGLEEAVYGRLPVKGELGKVELTTSIDLGSLLLSLPGTGPITGTSGASGSDADVECTVEGGALAVYTASVDLDSKAAATDNLHHNLRLLCRFRPDPPPLGRSLTGARRAGDELILSWEPSL